MGQRIDFNKVVMEVETDGSIEPEEALKKALEILMDHFKLVSEVKIEGKATKPKKVKAAAKKKAK